MNVVILSDYANVNGGASGVAIQSAIGLSRRGFNVFFLCGVGPVAEELIANGVEVLCLGEYDLLGNPNRLSAAFSSIWNRRASSKLSALLKMLDPSDTIVHVQTWTKSLSSSIVRKALDSGFSVALTLHDYFTACPNGGFFSFKKNQICRKRAMSIACMQDNCDQRAYLHKLFRVARQYVQMYLGGIPDSKVTFFSVSEFSEKILRPYFPNNCEFIRVRNPINIERESRPAVSENHDFVYIGRLVPEKGCTIFAEAASIANVRAIFVGEGELRSDINRINPDAVVTGWLSRDEVRKVLRSARALVFPSRLYETLGLSVLEALAMGIPVIVAEETAASGMVVRNVNGVTFPMGSVGSLADELKRFADDSDFVEELSHNAYRLYWSDAWSVDRHLDETASAYEAILKKGRSENHYCSRRI